MECRENLVLHLPMMLPANKIPLRYIWQKTLLPTRPLVSPQRRWNDSSNGEMVRSRHPNIPILTPGKGEFRYRSRAWKSLPSQTPCSHLVWGLVTNPGKGKVFVTQSHPTLCNLMDCNPLGSSVHGILQTGILEWVALPFSKESSWPREQTRVSCAAGRFVTNWATKETWLEAQPFPDVDPKIQLQQGLEG